MFIIAHHARLHHAFFLRYDNLFTRNDSVVEGLPCKRTSNLQRHLPVGCRVLTVQDVRGINTQCFPDYQMMVGSRLLCGRREHPCRWLHGILGAD